jgi:peptidoglycan/xylan/chitin deacetylase (PgdA/CDA1 family)
LSKPASTYDRPVSVPIAAVSATLVALVLAVGASPGPSTPAAAQQPATARVIVHQPARTPTPVPSAGPRAEPAAPAQPAAGKVDCRKARCIALTFDDGPVTQTASVLSALKARGARATFFVLGGMARQHPGLLRRMLAEGHAIGNHSWDHPQFFRMSSDAIRKEIRATDSAIRAATGVRPVMMRPPFGEQDARIRRSIRAAGDAVVLWNVDTEDWKYRDSKRLIGYVTKHAKRNAIVLMHDVRPTTRAAVPAIVAKLQAKGYTLVTVPELLRGRLKPGRVFTSG